MLQFSAQSFFLASQALRFIANDCLVSSLENGPEKPMFMMFSPLDEMVQRKAKQGLRDVQGEFAKIGLRMTKAATGDVLEELEREPLAKNCNVQWLLDQIRNIETLAKRELDDRAFFYVPAESAEYFPRRDTPNLFGDAVASAFHSTKFDLHEAGVCLALSRGTASVFHLMRILEIGLTALGKTFDVSLAHTNWGPAIEEIESKIRKMNQDPIWKASPDLKEQQEYYARAASHFGILKDAWRNYTMHARGPYTEEQAREVFDNVKGFMQKLAERMHE